MRVFLFSLFTFSGVVASAIATDASVTRFLPLEIDENSVRVVASSPIAGGPNYAIVVAFKILPKDSAEENYAGLHQLAGLPTFQAVYAYSGQPRVAPGNPRMVVAQFTVNPNRAGMPLNINGALYAFIPGRKDGEFELQKIRSAKR